MSLDKIRFDTVRLAICGDRLVQPALILQRYAEVEMGLSKVRFDADRLAIRCDRLVELALFGQR